jgi:hypothetical protein
MMRTMLLQATPSAGFDGDAPVVDRVVRAA